MAYTSEDIRFTCRHNFIYATFLGWPGRSAIIRFARAVRAGNLRHIYPEEIASVRMLGVDRELHWSMTDQGLETDVPDEKPCDHAFVFRITRKMPF